VISEKWTGSRADGPSRLAQRRAPAILQEEERGAQGRITTSRVAVGETLLNDSGPPHRSEDENLALVELHDSVENALSSGNTRNLLVDSAATGTRLAQRA
jgi:hypothetical protein